MMLLSFILPTYILGPASSLSFPLLLRKEIIDVLSRKLAWGSWTSSPVKNVMRSLARHQSSSEPRPPKKPLASPAFSACRSIPGLQRHALLVSSESLPLGRHSLSAILNQWNLTDDQCEAANHTDHRKPVTRASTSITKWAGAASYDCPLADSAP